MKFLFCLLILCSFPLFSQDAPSKWFPKGYSFSTIFQNEDIFISGGILKKIPSNFSAEFRWGVGIRRTFFQQALFSKTDLLLHYDILKSRKWEFGPSILGSLMSVAPRMFKPIQRYYSAEIGYYFAFGNKIKITNSSYFAFRSTDFVSVKNKYSFFGYSFQLGLKYEI